MNLFSGVTGAVVAIITEGHEAVLVDINTLEVINRIALLSDTGTRISFDSALNRFVLGSWKNGIKCIDLESGKQIWHKKYASYTHINIISTSAEIFVVGLKDDVNGCVILNLECGEQTNYINPCSSLLSKNNLRIGHDSLRDTLLIFDEHWNLIGRPKWRCFGLWDFAANDDGMIIVSGPSGYAGSFASNISSPLWEVDKGEYFFRIEKICWNRRRNCFFALVSEFEGSTDRVLVRLDHTLRSFDVVRKFPIGSREVICDDRYVVTESGIILDLDVEREIGMIAWDDLLK